MVSDSESLAAAQDRVLSDTVSGDERTEVEQDAIDAIGYLDRAAGAAWTPRDDVLRVTIFMGDEMLDDDDVTRAREAVIDAVAYADIGTVEIEAVEEEGPVEY